MNNKKYIIKKNRLNLDRFQALKRVILILISISISI